MTVDNFRIVRRGYDPDQVVAAIHRLSTRIRSLEAELEYERTRDAHHEAELVLQKARYEAEKIRLRAEAAAAETAKAEDFRRRLVDRWERGAEPVPGPQPAMEPGEDLVVDVREEPTSMYRRSRGLSRRRERHAKPPEAISSQ